MGRREYLPYYSHKSVSSIAVDLLLTMCNPLYVIYHHRWIFVCIIWIGNLQFFYAFDN
jgi:hypothetical protein